MYNNMTSNKSPSFDFNTKLPPMGQKSDFNKSNTLIGDEKNTVSSIILPNNDNKKINKKNKKNKKKLTRCQHETSKKKLPLVELKCKCGKLFCRQHFHYDKHECSFDRQTYYKNLLINKAGLGEGESDKIKDRI